MDHLQVMCPLTGNKKYINNICINLESFTYIAISKTTHWIICIQVYAGHIKCKAIIGVAFFVNFR